jgi:hypothetical protein
MKLALTTAALLCLSATPIEWPDIQCEGQPCNCMALYEPPHPAFPPHGCWIGDVAVWSKVGVARCE